LVFLWFFLKLFLSILFFNIEMIENLVLYFFSFILSFYEVSMVCGFIKVIQAAPVYECGVFFFLMMWGKHCNFIHKILWIATVFPHIIFVLHLVFFCLIFFKMHFNFPHITLWIAIVFLHIVFFFYTWFFYDFF